MSLLVEDDNVKSSKSNFSIFKNEKFKYEGKEVSAAQFAYKIQCGFFQAIDIEIINAVYLLKYSTSRQITQFLNLVRNIEIDQSRVTKRLTALNNSSCISRYSFFSDERTSETGLKCYVLKERGKRLLLQREYKCDWDIFTNVLALENIKNYLAQNNYICKLLSSKIIDFYDIKFTTCSIIYTVNNFKHLVVPLRSSDADKSIIKKIISQLNDFLNQKFKLIFICEDVMHMANIFKSILEFYKAKEIDTAIINSTYFTSDLRILEKDIACCFNIFIINDRKLTCEDVIIDELKNIVEK
ncbi:hypothetical protein [uncultured Clostridium sp.]|uniref:hypothetical protein n=1 Tax=uncultured Clostridium sp. TaxID=59620 RepID=UPI0028E670C0|nr:hypothetical protein [uncultured Clostridium sp.]